MCHFLITGDSPLTLGLWPGPGFVSEADGRIRSPRQWSPELLGEPSGPGGGGQVRRRHPSSLSPCGGPRGEGSCLLTKVNALSNGPSLVSGHLAESAGTSSRPLFRVTRSLEDVAQGDQPTTGAIVLACRGRGQPRPIWTGQGSRPQPLSGGPAKTLGTASLVHGERRWRPQGPGGASGDLP